MYGIVNKINVLKRVDKKVGYFVESMFLGSHRGLEHCRVHILRVVSFSCNKESGSQPGLGCLK